MDVCAMDIYMVQVPMKIIAISVMAMPTSRSEKPAWERLLRRPAGRSESGI
jgi:hypothetical protein